MRYTKHIAYAIKTLLCWVASYIVPWPLAAQEPPRPEIDINQYISDLFPVPPEGSDEAELFESLIQLYANPLDLNTATADELSSLFILSENQIQSLLKHRLELGPLISLYELQAVPGFDLNTIFKLLPFVVVNARPANFQAALRNPSQHFLMLRSGRLLEKQKGFSPLDTNSRSTTRYLGSPFNAFLRYRFSRSGSYSFGITLDKDSGEKTLEWNARRHIFGADFSSFHGQIMNRGRLKNLILGDYLLQAGQGLVFGAGFSLGKGSEVIKSAYRSTLGLKPYTSSTEADFFRGAAATFALTSQTEISLLFSKVKRDATQELAADPDSKSITSSLPVSGYHRTESENEKHNVLSEQNAGFHLLYKMPSQRGQAGFTALYTSYNSLLRKRDLPYNQFEFTGESNIITSAHADYRLQNYHLFGEAGLSKSGGAGAVGGAIVSLGKKWDATFLGRFYARDFHTFYGNALSESTRPINERAAYFGLRFTPVRAWQLSAYLDRYRFPWLKYQVDLPSRGFDYYLNAQWKPSKRLQVNALFQEKHKQRNPPKSDQPNFALATTVRRTLMLNFEFEKALKFALRSRVQLGDFRFRSLSQSRGITAFQDVSWFFPKIELSARIAWFHTDDYDSRQYAYEKDMLYAFSTPAYSDAGTRHYLMLKYALTRQMKCWLRWSQTQYRDLETISSGLNEIKGNRRSELKAQVMYQF